MKAILTLTLLNTILCIYPTSLRAQTLWHTNNGLLNTLSESVTNSDAESYIAANSITIINSTFSDAALTNFYAGSRKDFLPDYFANPQNDGYTHAEINNHVCSSEINGQKLMQDQGNEYHPMLNNSRWVSSINGFHGVIGFHNFTVSDTQINSLTYTKIRNQHVYFPGMYMDSSIVEGSMGGYVLLREDITQRKVYYWLNNQEYLRFDFTLEIGDTLPSDTSYIVIAIDSILTNAGYRRRFTASDGGIFNIEYVEGIGSLSDPIHGIYPVSNLSHLLCFYQNDNLTYDYGASFNVDCAVYSNVSEPYQPIKEISIFPNPTIYSFTLETGIKDKCKLRITDMYGKTVVSLFFSGPEYQVDISHLPAGIYNVVVTGHDEKLIGRNKLIVQ